MPYRTQSPDTSIEAERVQIESLRRMGARGRLARARSLTRTTQRLSRAALRRARPHLSEDELRREWIRLNYGLVVPEIPSHDS